MEYKIISNNSQDFWEDKKSNSFGLENSLTINLIKNIISVDSHGAEVYLARDNKKARISNSNKITKGEIKCGDKLYLNNEVIIEFISPIKRDKKILLPKINWNLWIGIIVLMVILTIIFFGWKKTTEDKLENNYQKVLTEINDNFAKSDDIKSIDPDTSLKILNESKSLILEIKNNKKHEAEVIDLEKQINEKLAISGSSEITNFEEIYDTKIADTIDRKYDKFMVLGDTAILVDSISRRIIDINLITKAISKFDVDNEITNIVDVSKSGKSIYVYDGRYIWDLQKNKIGDVGSEVFIKTYNWNNSWYLLGQDGKISKFTDSKMSNWTQNETTLVDRPVSMTIDGKVWVTDQTGNIANYEKGVYKKWIASITITNEKINSIITSTDSDKLALVSEKKVYVFDKNSGRLVASYNFEKIGIIAGQMGKNGQIYILGQDQKIYKVK